MEVYYDMDRDVLHLLFNNKMYKSLTNLVELVLSKYLLDV